MPLCRPVLRSVNMTSNSCPSRAVVAWTADETPVAVCPRSVSREISSSRNSKLSSTTRTRTSASTSPRRSRFPQNPSESPLA